MSAERIKRTFNLLHSKSGVGLLMASNFVQIVFGIPAEVVQFRCSAVMAAGVPTRLTLLLLTTYFACVRLTYQPH